MPADSGGVRILQDDGNALAGADAHTNCAVADVALTQFGGQRQHISGAGGPERMANGHGATLGVSFSSGIVKPPS